MLIAYITLIYLFVEPQPIYQLFEVERKKPKKKKKHIFTIMIIIILKYSTTNTRIEQLFRSRVQLATKQQLLYVIEAIKCYPQVDCQKKQAENVFICGDSMCKVSILRRFIFKKAKAIPKS